MRGRGRIMAMVALPYLIMLPPSHAQQSDSARQPAPGFAVAQTPALLSAPPHRASPPPPVQPALYYRPDAPHYVPPGTTAIQGWSIFNRRY
jgi:hypothetical protein